MKMIIVNGVECLRVGAAIYSTRGGMYRQKEGLEGMSKAGGHLTKISWAVDSSHLGTVIFFSTLRKFEK
ncbi:MAG: hypothetical protein ACKOAY_09870 [Haliscomenobacter sp.]